MAFGRVLARLRREKRLSQAALADLAGLSQRHISFLESGRSEPGRAALDKLVRALSSDYASANDLVTAAGFAPARLQLSWEDEGFASARHVIATMLRRHDPFPGMVLERIGNILQTNEGFDRTIAWAFDGGDPWALTCPGAVPNLYDLTLHPDGLCRFLVNPEEVVPHTLRRLRHAAETQSEAMAVLERVMRYEAAQAYRHVPEASGSRTASVVCEVYRVDDTTLRLISMTAGFGSPEDVTAQSIQLELFFPADLETEQALKT